MGDSALADTETCKREVELTVSLLEVADETDRVVAQFQQKVRLPGFRPGKAPASMVKSRFAQDIRQQVVEQLVPKTFRAHADQEHLQVVGQPNITAIHFHDGEPLKFKAEFEVAPEFELGDYKGIEVPYEEPKVSDEDVEARLDVIRNQKADYVNIDPRMAEAGDHAVVSLKSIAGVEGDPIDQEELMLHIGADETLPEFTATLTGMNPGEEKDVDVAYPADYGAERLAGKTVTFHLTLTGLRRKDLPEANDEFAKDLGDYQGIAELRDEIRKAILREREFSAQQEAKNKVMDKLVDAHVFPVPEVFVDHQIKVSLESRLRELASAGADLSNLKLNWADVREAQKESASRDVRASLLLEKIADREAVGVTEEELDREVQRMARQQREPVATVRKRLEEDGSIGRLAGRIRTDKTLSLLFEEARKVAPPAPSPEAA